MREERKQDTERHEDENKEGDRKSQSPLEFTIQKIHQKGVRKGKLRHLRKEKKRQERKLLQPVFPWGQPGQERSQLSFLQDAKC